MARYGRDQERGRWGQRERGGGGGYGGSGRGEEHGGNWRGGGYGRPREGQGGWGAGRSDYAGGYGEDFGERGGWSAGRGGDVYGAGYGYEGGGYGERDYSSGYGRGGPGYTDGERESHGRSGQDELRRLRAADIMTENPETVTPDTSLAEAAQKMRDLNVGIIPVVESAENRRLRGVVTDRDIAIRAVADGMDARGTTVSVVMTTEVEVCNKNDSVGDVLRVMEREQVRRVPITDRDGRLVGIVAQADVARDVDSDRGERRVAHTLERISEPARGGREGQRASQSRDESGGAGGMQGSTGESPRNPNEGLGAGGNQNA